MTWRRAAAVAVIAAALPYLNTLDNYFVQDDFGVVALLSSKPATYFPHWFVTTWMDDIWGYTPDEVRPFPAVSYQVAAVFGAASPYANHVINIAFHALNAVLVLAVAIEAAGLTVVPALVAAVVFAVLPMQTETVAWITGRVDSMPACFFLAAFLCFARWRASHRRRAYVWAVAWCAVALLSKQNTVILAPCLMAYDLVVRRQPVRATWDWLRPYLPFIALTVAYLGLRYVLFGEVARESMLNAAQVRIFAADLAVHLKRMAYGESGVAMSGPRVLTWVLGAGIVTAVYAARTGGGRAAPLAFAAAFFGPIWIGVSAAPTLVAGYASPRHMYLAAVGWAVLLALPLEVLWRRDARPARWLAAGLATAITVAYATELRRDLARWELRSAVSQDIVRTLNDEAGRAPVGTLVLVAAPRSSFDFAVPHALRPPFTPTDLTARLRVVTPSMVSCCPHQWGPQTRATLAAWLADPAQPPIVALYWDPVTGRAARADDTAQPFMRALPAVFGEIHDDASLDAAIVDGVEKLTGGELRTAPGR
jgi:hypothetical protein